MCEMFANNLIINKIVMNRCFNPLPLCLYGYFPQEIYPNSFQGQKNPRLGKKKLDNYQYDNIAFYCPKSNRSR